MTTNWYFLLVELTHTQHSSGWLLCLNLAQSSHGNSCPILNPSMVGIVKTKLISSFSEISIQKPDIDSADSRSSLGYSVRMCSTKFTYSETSNLIDWHSAVQLRQLAWLFHALYNFPFLFLLANQSFNYLIFLNI